MEFNPAFLPALEDDQRGWILASVSGMACVLGSSIICIDFVTKCIPRFRDFNIRKNNTFLSASLSLSFGVMIFSALYGILPEASAYLIRGGKSPQSAKLMSIGFFMVGVTGLSIISEILHRSLPSSIVHCEHSDAKEHPADDDGSESESEHSHDHHHEHAHSHTHNQQNTAAPRPDMLSRAQTDGAAFPPSEHTPLLYNDAHSRTGPLGLRLPESVASLVTGKVACTGDGTCYGFSESRPCDRMCLPHIKAARVKNPLGSSENGQSVGLLVDIDEDGQADLEQAWDVPRPVPITRNRSTTSAHSHDHAGHHHVPKNEFLSIGIQTSLAIALHKIPEGFITFATNHANPKLGFAVFLALAIHNVSEGFVMSLPLFLAFKSRFTAILWASILGGLSQPAGALCASLWFKSHNGDPPSDVVYGVLFAIIAGIMCNVAIQLYGQAVSIYHNQKLPLVFAFLGISILGVSFALNE